MAIAPTLLDKLLHWHNKHFLNPQIGFYKTQKIRNMKRSKKSNKKAPTSKENP